MLGFAALTPTCRTHAPGPACAGIVDRHRPKRWTGFTRNNTVPRCRLNLHVRGRGMRRIIVLSLNQLLTTNMVYVVTCNSALTPTNLHGGES